MQSRFFLQRSVLRHTTSFLRVQPRFFCQTANALSVDDISGRVISVARAQERAKKDVEITADTHLAHDLGLDSLDQVEFGLALEEEFSIEIADEDAETINTVGAAIQFIQDNPHAK